MRTKQRDPDGVILPQGITYKEGQGYIVQLWTPKYLYQGSYPTLAKALNGLAVAHKRRQGVKLPDVEDWIKTKPKTNQPPEAEDFLKPRKKTEKVQTTPFFAPKTNLTNPLPQSVPTEIPKPPVTFALPRSVEIPTDIEHSSSRLTAAQCEALASIPSKATRIVRVIERA
jgi:hypothetical protein